jgi:hypothetical protein
MTCGMCDAYPARIRLLWVTFLGEARKVTRQQAKPALNAGRHQLKSN